MGWGQIVRSLGLPQSNRNRNLGQIMSGRGPKHGPGSDDTTVSAPQNQPQPVAKPHGSGGNGGGGGNGNGGSNGHGGGNGQGGDKEHGNGGGNGKKNK
jgi:hypothetical protein